jgi:hypothetical protein
MIEWIEVDPAILMLNGSLLWGLDSTFLFRDDRRNTEGEIGIRLRFRESTTKHAPDLIQIAKNRKERRVNLL